MLTILKLLGMVNPFVPMTEISPLVCVYFNNLRPSCRDIDSYAFQKSVTWYKNNWWNRHSFIEKKLKLGWPFHEITKGVGWTLWGRGVGTYKTLLCSLTKLTTTKRWWWCNFRDDDLELKSAMNASRNTVLQYIVSCCTILHQVTIEYDGFSVII